MAYFSASDAATDAQIQRAPPGADPHCGRNPPIEGRKGAGPRPFQGQQEINTRFGLDANPIKRNIASKFSHGMGTENARRQTENTASSCPIGAFS
jgi:hypothetical protein